MTQRRVAPIPGPDGTALPITRTWHWGRIILAVIALIIVLRLAYAFVFNPKLEWPPVGHYLFNGRILSGILVTIEISVLATVIGLVLGVILAVMRLSHNQVLRWISTLYIGFFRGTPVLVQLIFWYNMAFLFPNLILKIPFTMIGVYWDTNQVITGFTAATLGLNMAAYFAETVRAGIQAVDAGPSEAAYALGMRPAQRMRVIVLPQAIRIIIPPTGNEFISMLKTISLVYVVAGHDLMTNASQIYKENNLIMELLIVASIWYLVMTAIATVLQGMLERRFGSDAVRIARKGGISSALMPDRPAKEGAMA